VQGNPIVGFREAALRGTKVAGVVNLAEATSLGTWQMRKQQNSSVRMNSVRMDPILGLTCALHWEQVGSFLNDDGHGRNKARLRIALNGNLEEIRMVLNGSIGEISPLTGQTGTVSTKDVLVSLLRLLKVTLLGFELAIELRAACSL
jgi:hypothetical protein